MGDITHTAHNETQWIRMEWDQWKALTSEVERLSAAVAAWESKAIQIGLPTDPEAATTLANQWHAEVERQQAQLAECYRLTGADPDGNEDWRLARDAVAEVRRMRQEMDERESHVCHTDRMTDDPDGGICVHCGRTLFPTFSGDIDPSTRTTRPSEILESGMDDEHRRVVNRVAEKLYVEPTITRHGYTRDSPERCFEMAKAFWEARQAHWKEQG